MLIETRFLKKGSSAEALSADTLQKLIEVGLARRRHGDDAACPTSR